MVAVNTVNYGKAYKLSCAEALAGALHVCGFYQNAYNLMNKFKWGPTFFVVNAYFFNSREVFEKYDGCNTVNELK